MLDLSDGKTLISAYKFIERTCNAIDEFIFNCQSRDLSQGTVTRYTKMLNIFKVFLHEEEIDEIEKIKAIHIRKFINQ